MNHQTRSHWIVPSLALVLLVAAPLAARSAGAIQPRDGLWKAELSGHTMDGCSGMMASAIKSAMANMTAKQETHRLDFDTPFHPGPLMQGAEDMQWQRTGVNTWHGVMAQNKGSGESMSITVTLDVEVLSPTHIEEVEVFDMKMSPALARIMGGSGQCSATVHARLDWVE